MNGGKLQTVRKNDRRSELVSLMRRLAGYVAGTCDGDLVKLLSSGFPIHEPSRHAVGYLSAPEAPVMKQGANSGVLIGRIKRPYGAKMCSWVLALSTSPDVAVQTILTTGVRAEFKGLIPGQTYVVKANVISTAGPSNWTSPGRRMVI